MLVGFYFHGDAESLAAAADAPVVLNAWIHVGTDNFVTILIDKSEMGQSILTGLAMIAADELDCDWKNVRTEFAPADKVYINPRFGVQGTGGSSGTPTSWNPLAQGQRYCARYADSGSGSEMGRGCLSVQRGKQ